MKRQVGPEIIHQSGVGGHQFAPFSLREADIEAVKNTESGLVGDSQGATHQRHGRINVEASPP
jgi:hypothetical protein